MQGLYESEITAGGRSVPVSGIGVFQDLSRYWTEGLSRNPRAPLQDVALLGGAVSERTAEMCAYRCFPLAEEYYGLAQLTRVLRRLIPRG